jgi:hypothetical protein
MTTSTTRGRGKAVTPEYESLRDASARTGYSVSSLRGWIRAGRLEALRIGPATRAPIRLRVADVDALVRPAGPFLPTPLTAGRADNA